MADCYITHALRTPIGGFGKGLAGIPAPELGAILVRTFIGQKACAPTEIDRVIFGNALQAGLGMNPARQAAVRGGISYAVPAYTVNMVCASGLQAILLADQRMKSGGAQRIIAGGFENMSRAPSDLMLKDGLMDAFYDVHMANTVENLIRQYEIPRQAQDEFALESHRKAIAAMVAGSFIDEIVPVQVNGFQITEDERPRVDTTLAKLARLEPIFDPDGTITAGNASGVNDGAAAIVLSSEESGKKTAFCAEIVDEALVAVDPMEMGVAPVLAIKKLLARTKLALGDIGLWELNEAFAGQCLAVLKEIPIPLAKLNVNGGAIALGHPIGCSGARILVTLLHAMKRRDIELGIAALCVGGGLGQAVLVRHLG